MTRPPVDLRSFFAPTGVALIGRVDRDAGETALLAANDDRWGAGNWYLVNPRGESLGSIPVHGSIGDIDAPITLAVISTPASTCAQIVRECGAAGVQFALVFSSGFSEVGVEGAVFETELAEAGREAGVRIIGPNTNTNAFERLPDLPDRFGGRIGVVTQSGHNGRPIVQGAEFGVRFSRLIPTGNEADVDICDFIEHLAADDTTSVIAAYVEGFRDGDRQCRALTVANDAEMPVVIMKIGASEAGARMAQTHTGHMVGSDAIADSIFERHGVTRVYDLDELLETSALFAKLPPDTGPRMALYSISGGSGTLMAEVAELHGVPIPELTAETQRRLRQHIPGHLTVANPIDNGGTFVLTHPPEIRRQLLRDILDDPSVDGLVIGVTGAVPPMTDMLAEDVLALAGEVGKPIIATWNSPRVDEDRFRTLVDSGVPLFRSFRNCFGALAAFETQRHARSAFRTRPAARADVAVPALAPIGEPQVLDSATSHQLLTAFGIPAAPHVVVTSAGDAHAAAEALNGRVAMKIASADIAHKSDLGLVRLDVASADSPAMFAELIEAAGAAAPAAAIDGVLVQPMVDAGREMIVGVIRDPILGPAVVVGTGGIYAEILDDRVVRPVPIDRRDAQEMVAALKGYALLAGARGEEPADIDALVEIILNVGTLASKLGDTLEELDLNPVVVGPRGKGAVAVDNLVVFAAHVAEESV